MKTSTSPRPGATSGARVGGRRGAKARRERSVVLARSSALAAAALERVSPAPGVAPSVAPASPTG
eukprot:14411130-Alexandrium_andersonii.AAC.1